MSLYYLSSLRVGQTMGGVAQIFLCLDTRWSHKHVTRDRDHCLPSWLTNLWNNGFEYSRYKFVALATCRPNYYPSAHHNCAILNLHCHWPCLHHWSRKYGLIWFHRPFQLHLWYGNSSLSTRLSSWRGSCLETWHVLYHFVRFFHSISIHNHWHTQMRLCFFSDGFVQVMLTI